MPIFTKNHPEPPAPIIEKIAKAALYISVTACLFKIYSEAITSIWLFILIAVYFIFAVIYVKSPFLRRVIGLAFALAGLFFSLLPYLAKINIK
jgi:hypothetical protein